MTPEEATREVWDVVVVGAGPAGSIAARELARRGQRVILLDKATFPRGKVCGCCLNDSALSTLTAIGLGALPKQCGAVSLSSVRLAAGGRSATLPLPGGVALSREAFDMALIRAAIEEGVVFLDGVSMKMMGHTLLFDSQRTSLPLSARLVIAADGLNGQFTAENGQRSEIAPKSRIGAGTIANHAPKFYQSGTIFMAVGTGGYVGLVRLEDGRLDLAAAFDPTFIRKVNGLSEAAASILNEAGFPGVPDLRWRGTPPLTRQARRIAGDCWFAIGDATGYVEPFTGEGMAWAMASGVAVAELASREWTGSRITEWAATHSRLVRSRQGMCKVVARVLRSAHGSRLVVRLLSWLPALSGPVVRALNRPATT